MIEWRCLTLSTEGKKDWRRVLAINERAAANSLIDEGLVPLDIRSGPMALSEILRQPIHIGPPISMGDQALMLTQIAMLLRAGMPIDRSIDLLRDQMPKRGQRIYLADVLARIRGGDTLARSLECRKIFPVYVTGVIAAAEGAGNLDHAFAILSDRMNEIAKAQRELTTALTYPLAILVATILSIFVIVTLVIPQFEPIFAGESARLPLLTNIVLWLSQSLKAGFATFIATIAGTTGLIIAWMKYGSGREWIARHQRIIPFMQLRDQYLAANFATIMGMLLENGLPVIKALPLTRSSLASVRWRNWCAGVEHHLRAGHPLSQALRIETLLPIAVVRLTEVGEQGGRLGEALTEAGRILHANAKARLDRIIALASPVAIAALGAIVALLIGGVMLGIFALGDFAG